MKATVEKLNLMLWDIEAALDKMEFWRPIYVAIRAKGHTREETMDAIKWLMKIEAGGSVTKE